MRSIAILTAFAGIFGTSVSAEITGTDDEAMRALIAGSTSLIENDGDYHHSLPYSTLTGAYGFTFGELISLGQINRSDVCSQNCFSTNFWDGAKWVGGMEIGNRKVFAESVDAQDYVMRSRVMMIAALIDGYVDDGEKIGFRTITQGGAISAASLIGPYAFRVWRNSGYSIDGIPNDIVSMSGMSRNKLYAELVKRLTDKDAPQAVTFTDAGTIPTDSERDAAAKTPNRGDVMIEMGAVEPPL